MKQFTPASILEQTTQIWDKTWGWVAPGTIPASSGNVTAAVVVPCLAQPSSMGPGPLMPLHPWCRTATSYTERKVVFLPRTLLQINVPGITYTLVARCIICSCRGRQVCSFSIINENRPLPLKDSRKRPYGFNSHPSFPGQKCLLDVSVATWQGQIVSRSPHRAQRGFLRTRGVILQWVSATVQCFLLTALTFPWD